MSPHRVRPEPQVNDPRYQDYDEYLRDVREWDREETIRKVKDLPGFDAAGWGIGFGSAMAMILSFELNHSVLWMIVHGICSWFYVIYRVWQGNY